MHFTVFYFALLNFLSDSLILKVRVRQLDLKKSCKSSEILLITVTETVPKTHNNRSRIYFRGTMTPPTPLIFSHSQLHLSLDSYTYGVLELCFMFIIYFPEQNHVCSLNRRFQPYQILKILIHQMQINTLK